MKQGENPTSAQKFASSPISTFPSCPLLIRHYRQILILRSTGSSSILLNDLAPALFPSYKHNLRLLIGLKPETLISTCILHLLCEFPFRDLPVGSSLSTGKVSYCGYFSKETAFAPVMRTLNGSNSFLPSVHNIHLFTEWSDVISSILMNGKP